jgi:hypothetical protein
MIHRKFALDSPEVITILANVWKSGTKSYYRIVDGKHMQIPIRGELMALGMCSKTATTLLSEAKIPSGKFVYNKPEIKSKLTEAAQAREEAKLQASEKRAAKAAKAEAIASSKRFQLIQTNSNKHGIWDAENGTVTSLYWTKEEAVAELARLRSGGFRAVNYSGSPSKPRPEITY